MKWTNKWEQKNENKSVHTRCCEEIHVSQRQKGQSRIRRTRITLNDRYFESEHRAQNQKSKKWRTELEITDVLSEEKKFIM